MTRKTRSQPQKPLPRATIKEVAALAGVALGTASRVINKNSRVSLENKAKVNAAIAKLGYKPDMVAQSMRNGESHTVGILVRNITSPVLAGFVRGAQDVLSEQGYTVLLGCSEESREREVNFLMSAASRRIDGLIMITTSEDDPELLSLRQDINIPTILFDREIPESFDALLMAHEQGIRQSLEHLFSLGHRRIALLTGNDNVFPARARLRGYRSFFEARGLPVNEGLISANTFTSEGAFVETSAVLGMAQPPTAIILGGISMLAGSLSAIKARGLRIPEDVSLVASGDSDLAMFATPPISVVRWNNTEVGRTCALLLLERMKGATPAEARRIIVPTEYLIRGSCGPCPSAPLKSQ
ncbi:MAG: transcriptional regulator [Polaromonas sp.]|nr:transcriptional regulator [Polaromonas sp.]